MPKLLTTPFANDAPSELRTDIQVDTGAAPNSATYRMGFPEETMKSISSGGLPPKGPDFNGVLYDITDNISYLNKGLAYTYDAAFATEIGGYPLHARIMLDSGDIVVNTIASNTNNPNTNMTGWELQNKNTVTSKDEDYYEASLEFGESSKVKIFVKNNGVMSVDVKRDNVSIAEKVTVPYSINMQPYRSETNMPFKRLFIPSAGFEDSNQSASLVFGYNGEKQKLALMNVNDLIPFDPEFGETENQTSVVTVLDYPYQSVTLPENNDYLPKYLKIAEIPARSDFSLFSCDFFGGWNNERLSEKTTLTFQNYGNINWDNASSFTDREWNTFFKVVADGTQGNRFGLKALNFAVKYVNNNIEVYVVLPPYSYYTALVTCKKNCTSFLNLDQMSFTSPDTTISIFRGTSLNTTNSGIASDGTVVMCDAHIRIARSSNPSDTTRELTSNGYHWIGSGTSNLPFYSNVTIEKIATGTYRLNNIAGLWNAEVRLRQPYDLDGNQVAIASISGTTPTIYVNEIKYTVQSGGTNVIREKGNLIDIPANAWVDVFYSENWS